MTMPDPNAPPLTPVTTLRNQIDAATRHLVTAGGTAFTILGALALLPPDKVMLLINTLQDAGTHLTALTGDIGVLITVLGPIVVGFAIKGATFAASLKGQLRSIARNPDVVIPPQSKIIVPPPVAAAVPIPQVVPPS